MGKGVYVKPQPIGSKVKTTDDVYQAGYDYIPLYMGGMLIVDKDTVKPGAATPIVAGTVAKP